MESEGIAAWLQDQGFLPKISWIRSVLDSGSKTFEDVLEILLNSNFERYSESGPSIKLSPFYIFREVRVFQVNEVVDVSANENGRRKGFVNPFPTLKVLMADGGTRLVGVVRERIEVITVDSVGIKIEIGVGSVMRYGVLMMFQKNVKILGGSCQELIDMKKRFLEKSGHGVLDLMNKLSETSNLRFPTEIKTVFLGEREKNNIENRVLTPPSGELDVQEATYGGQSSPHVLELHDLAAPRPFTPLLLVIGRVFCAYELTVDSTGTYCMRCEVSERKGESSITAEVKPSLLRIVIGIEESQWGSSDEQFRLEAKQECMSRLEGLGPVLALIDKGPSPPGVPRYCLTTELHERDPNMFS
jgi:hypothetical protein